MRYQLCAQSKSLAALAYMYSNFLVILCGIRFDSKISEKSQLTVSELYTGPHFRAHCIGDVIARGSLAF